MINFLCNIFIKNNEDILNPTVRKEYGALTGILGILNNVFLFLIKFFAGIITGAISITADAFNNLSDAGSSIITLIGFRMAEKPADSDHPYGHGRIEYISGLIIAIIIIIMGIELLKSSINKIINPTPVDFSILTVIILVVSILVKIWMTHYNKKLGKKLDSSAMLATAADSLNDSIATTSVLICLIIGHFTNINIDGYAGSAVALFVLFSGYQTAKETLQPLLGEAPNADFVKQIEDTVLSYDDIRGIHDLIVHDYGPGRVMVSLHAEIPCDMDIIKAHDIIDAAEESIKQNMGCDICIHMDPIVTKDRKSKRLKQLAIKTVKSVDNSLDIHDFRVSDTDDNLTLTFDADAPYDLKLTDEEIENLILEKFENQQPDFNIKIEAVDRKN